ncbi:MAG: hypothetical protein Tsb008_05840 [Rhodothalassiaceae bacterium]
MSLRMRPLHWVLALSLALNLFIGGQFLGRALFGHGDHHDHHASRGDAFSLRLELRALESALGPEGREALRASMRARRSEMGPRFEAVRLGRDRVTAALAAEPFDADALAEAFAALNRALGTLQEPIQQTILEAAGNMSHEERRRMADALDSLRADINRRHERHRAAREDGGDDDR